MNKRIKQQNSCALCQQQSVLLLGLCPTCLNTTPQLNRPDKVTAPEIFGTVISSYSRGQAIEDGVLVDLSQMTEDEGDSGSIAALCRQHYKWPIALTNSVWGIIEEAVGNPETLSTRAGILHDILWMSRVRKQQVNAQTIFFEVVIAGAGREKPIKFKLVSGTGDEGEPVLTLMLPYED